VQGQIEENTSLHKNGQLRVASKRYVTMACDSSPIRQFRQLCSCWAAWRRVQELIDSQWRSQGFDPGGMKILLGRHSGVNFLTTFFFFYSFLLFSSSTTRGGGGRRTRRPRGAIPSGKGARGARCPLPPGSATVDSRLIT
jgi:hypothetical protein